METARNEAPNVGKAIYSQSINHEIRCLSKPSQFRRFWRVLQDLASSITENKHRCCQNKPQNKQQMNCKTVHVLSADWKSMKKRFWLERNWKIAWNCHCTRIQGPRDSIRIVGKKRRRKFSPTSSSPGQEIVEKQFLFLMTRPLATPPSQQVIAEKNNFHNFSSSRDRRAAKKKTPIRVPKNAHSIGKSGEQAAEFVPKIS